MRTSLKASLVPTGSTLSASPTLRCSAWFSRASLTFFSSSACISSAWRALRISSWFLYGFFRYRKAPSLQAFMANSSSPWAVTTMTLASGSWERAALRTAIPSAPGRRRSVITRSTGPCSLSHPMAASPDSLPSTSKPLRLKSTESASRTPDSSSTTRTLGNRSLAIWSNIPRRRRRALFDARERDPEDGPPAGRGVDPHYPTVQIHDPVDDRQAHAESPLARCEERIEDPLPHARVDAGAVVTHFEGHQRRTGPVESRQVGIHSHSHLHPTRNAVADRFAGVGDQIQHDLLQKVVVALHPVGTGRRGERDPRRPLRRRYPVHLGRVLHDLHEVDPRAVPQLGSRERHEVLDQGGEAIGFADDETHQPPVLRLPLLAIAVFALEELDRGTDRRQRVADLVRQTRGEDRDRLVTIGLTSEVLEALDVLEVLEDRRRASLGASRTVEHRGRHAERARSRHTRRQHDLHEVDLAAVAQGADHQLVQLAHAARLGALPHLAGAGGAADPELDLGRVVYEVDLLVGVDREDSALHRVKQVLRVDAGVSELLLQLGQPGALEPQPASGQTAGHSDDREHHRGEGQAPENRGGRAVPVGKHDFACRTGVNR